jgi:hypothetical protein
MTQSWRVLSSLSGVSCSSMGKCLADCRHREDTGIRFVTTLANLDDKQIEASVYPLGGFVLLICLHLEGEEPRHEAY